jgi:Fe-S-cluster containining protein
MQQPVSPSSSTSTFVTANIEFSIAGNLIRANFRMPAGPARLSDLLPACRSVADAVVSIAARTSEACGKSISCKAGCGACCRQLVPVSEPEARVIANLVANMPEPRQSVILERFKQARERLAETGAHEKLADTDCFPYESLREFGTEYFDLGIPCPFLENESCSIYEERPVICREFLVTSDPKHCAKPSAETIDTVPLATHVSAALVRVGLKPGVTHARWVPLILALDWVEEHGEEPDERTGPEMLEELFAKMAEKSAKMVPVDRASLGSPTGADGNKPAEVNEPAQGDPQTAAAGAMAP